MALVVVEQDSYEEPALNLTTIQNNFLRCHIAEYDTRLFVFKTRQRNVLSVPDLSFRMVWCAEWLYTYVFL